MSFFRDGMLMRSRLPRRSRPGALVVNTLRLILLILLILSGSTSLITLAQPGAPAVPPVAVASTPAAALSLRDGLASLMPLGLDLPKLGVGGLAAGNPDNGQAVLLDNADIAVGITGDSTTSTCETKTYTYSILNIGTVPLNDVVATIHLANLTGFDYITGTAILDLDGAHVLCTVDPQVSGSDLIWTVDADCGISQALGVGQTLNVTFDLVADCAAVSGSLSASVAYQRGATAVSDDQAVHDITVLPGAIQVRKEPHMLPAAVGDPATFTIEVENTGLGVITNVEVTDVIGAGLRFVSASPAGVNVGQTTTWTSAQVAGLAVMNAGDIVSIDVTADVIACENLGTTTNARWGCGPSAICYDTATQGGGASAAVQPLLQTPRISYAPPDITFDTCQDTVAAAFAIANVGDGTAYAVQLVVDFGLMVSNVSSGAVYNAAATRFELTDPIPPGGSYNLSYNLNHVAWCDDFPSGDLLWQTVYRDACGNNSYAPIALSQIHPPANSASVSASLTGAPSIVQYGEPVSYGIASAYSGPISCGQGNVGLVTVTDTVPDGWTVSNAGGGVWTPGSGGVGGVITWQYLPPASLATSIVISPPPADQCTTYCSTTFSSTLSAVGVDCCGCALSASDEATTALVCQEGVDATRTVSGAAGRCDAVTYTNIYLFSGDSSVVLSDLSFTELADLDQLYVVGSLSINLSGVGDITGCAQFTDTTPGAGGSVSLDFSGCAATPLAGQTLAIVYDLQFSEDNAAACASESLTSWSRLDLGYVAPGGCLGDGIIHAATTASVQAPSMTVDVTGIGPMLNTCETSTATITLRRTSSVAQPKDVKLTLSGLNYYLVNPGAVVCSGSVAPVSCVPTIDGGGDYVWTFNDVFAANSDQAVLTFDVQKRCSGGGDLVATATYDDLCSDDATADATCTATGRDGPVLLTSGDLLIQVTPEQYLAETNQATWKIYVTNRGSGDARNVWVDAVLGSGLDYQGSSVVASTGVAITSDQDHNGGAINGATISIDQIEAGSRREITLVADLVSCANLTLAAMSGFGCVGVNCQTPVSDASGVIVPPPSLVTSNTVTPPLTACSGATGGIILRNTGPVNLHSLEAQVALPAGMSYLPGSTRFRVSGGAWSGPNGAFDPSFVGNDLYWSEDEIAPMVMLAKGGSLEIEYELGSDCSMTGGDVTVSTTYQNPCGATYQAPDSVYAVYLNSPSLEVNIDRISEPIGCDDAVGWTVTVRNNSGYDMPVVYVQDILGDGFTFDHTNTAWAGDYAGIPLYESGDTVAWELTNLGNGVTAELTIFATSDTAPCGSDLEHEVVVRWGCGTPDGDPSTVPGSAGDAAATCLSAASFGDTHTATREPDLSFASVSFAPSSIGTCGDASEVTIVIDNTGPTDALNTDLVIVLPDGLSYVAGSSALSCGGVSSDPIADPAISGASNSTLTYADPQNKADNLCSLIQAAGGNDQLTLKFSVQSACYQPADMHLTLYYYDCCDDIRYSTAQNVQLAGSYPQLDITTTPLTQTVDCQGLITWTMAVTNHGDGNAQTVLVEDTLGAWFDYVSASPTAYLISGQTYGWEFNDLGVGETKVLTMTGRLNPDTQNSCTADLRQNSARAIWACGTAGDAIDGDPTTRAYDCTFGAWADAVAAVALMPNLQVSSVTPTILCEADGVISGSITVTVRNVGDAASQTGFTVQVTDGKGWTGTGATISDLDPGASRVITINTDTWAPACHDCGDPYQFIATVDLDDDVCECDETDNTRSQNDIAPIADLTITDIDFSQVTCSSDDLAGTVQVAVRNAGCTAASNIAVRLVSDGCLSFGDQTIATLAAGASALVSFPALPGSGPYDGSCDITATVDPDDTVWECDGTNNTRTEPYASPLPDLVVNDTDLDLVCRGSQYVLSAGRIQLLNQGGGDVISTGSFAVRMTLFDGADCGGSPLDQWTQYSPAVNLAADGTMWLNIGDRFGRGNLCALGEACRVSLRIEIDAGDAICESSGANNVTCVNLDVGFSDLTVTDVRYLGLTPGQPQARVVADLANIGCGDATNAMVTITSDCGVVFPAQYVDLAAGQQAQLSWYFDPPTCEGCACAFTVKIDAADAVCECDETNNVRTSAQEDLRPILEMSKTTPRQNVYIGEVISYTLVVSNSGDANAAGVVISDALSGGLAFVGPVTLEGSLGTVAQSAADLPTLASGVTVRAGERVTLTLPVQVTGLGPIHNRAWAGALGGLVAPTEDDEDILALALPTSMTGGADPFCPGWTLRYSFWLTNTLPDVLTDLVVWDDLPAEVCCPTDVAWNGRPFDVSSDGRRVTWRIPSLQPGETIRLGVGLHAYPNLADGTLVENTMTYQAERLGEARSETIILAADSSVCGQPKPTPAPTTSLLRLYVPLLLKS